MNLDYNSKESLMAWMLNALDVSESKLGITKEERQLLERIGREEIDKGGWRGDVSQKWIKLGFHSDKIHDLYP